MTASESRASFYRDSATSLVELAPRWAGMTPRDRYEICDGIDEAHENRLSALEEEPTAEAIRIVREGDASMRQCREMLRDIRREDYASPAEPPTSL